MRVREMKKGVGDVKEWRKVFTRARTRPLQNRSLTWEQFSEAFSLKFGLHLEPALEVLRLSFDETFSWCTECLKYHPDLIQGRGSGEQNGVTDHLSENAAYAPYVGRLLVPDSQEYLRCTVVSGNCRGERPKD